MGFNVQYPICQLITEGKKTIETRTYPIPKHFIGIEMALIETPGKRGNFKARAVAKIVFGDSFKYPNKQDFYNDIKRHYVDPLSDWAWNEKKGKWGWPILKVTKLLEPLLLNKPSGIIYTTNIKIQ